MMYIFNWVKALYRRNNYNEPCVWAIEKFDDTSLNIYHGVVGKKLIKDIIVTPRNLDVEIKSRTNAKRKAGYKYLYEIKDNVNLPVEGELLNYLNTYLPIDRTNSEGNLLPMLAKVFDNTRNKLFKNVASYIGQWKINGLRCFIKVEINENDLFNKYKLIFQSREGTIWTSLNNLEQYLLSVIDDKLLKHMWEQHIALDGELYIPNCTVNQINHYVKDPTSFRNKDVQYWCYDLAVEDTPQYRRTYLLRSSFANFLIDIKSKEEHLANTNRFVVLPTFLIYSEDDAFNYRNEFIDIGFEGLIMRHPDKEYQFGKRNGSMIKYKRTTDGVFTIVDIYPEGGIRHEIPLFKCKNDINNETFEVHINGTLDSQAYYLKHRDEYIGKKLYISYGERSGVNQVPFHVKEVKLYGNN